MALLAAFSLPPAAFLAAAQVTLTWQDNANNEAGFTIERGEGASGAFAPLGQAGTNSTAFVDEAVVAGSVYRYRVRAFNSAGQSAYSNTATVTANAVGGTVPLGPTGAIATQPSELLNVSTRGNVTATDATIIPGFVVGPGAGRAVLIRVVGPTLGAAPFNVPGVCADPVLSVRNQAGAEIASSDNWSGSAVSDAATATGAFALPAGSRDAALVLTLPPGQYTVVVRGVAGATGVALAEVYALPLP